jgi:hypothetical protein
MVQLVLDGPYTLCERRKHVGFKEEVLRLSGRVLDRVDLDPARL